MGCEFVQVDVDDVLPDELPPPLFDWGAGVEVGVEVRITVGVGVLVGIGVAVGRISVGVGVGVAVGGIDVGIAVGTTQVGEVIVSLSVEIVPLTDKALPVHATDDPTVIAVASKAVPANVELAPSVIAPPGVQKTSHADAVPNVTVVLAVVFSAPVLLNIYVPPLWSVIPDTTDIAPVIQYTPGASGCAKVLKSVAAGKLKVHPCPLRLVKAVPWSIPA